MDKTLREIMFECHQNARDKGWWLPYMARENQIRMLSADQILSKLMLINTELAEAAEEARLPNFDPQAVYFKDETQTSGPGSYATKVDWPKHEDGKLSMSHPLTKPEGFGVEIADALIRIVDLCAAMNIDLPTLVEIKHQYNKSRSQRHGNKRA